MSDPLRIAFGVAVVDDGDLVQVSFLGTCNPDGSHPDYNKEAGSAAALRIGLVLVDGELLDVLAWQRVVLSGPPRLNGVRPSACMDASGAKVASARRRLDTQENRDYWAMVDEAGKRVQELAESLEARRAAAKAAEAAADAQPEWKKGSIEFSGPDIRESLP